MVITANAYYRVFAAACIVWFHAANDGPLSGFFGGIGLMIFCYLSFLQTSDDRSIFRALQRRAMQLLIPWAAWWLFYAMIDLLREGGFPQELKNATSILPFLSWPIDHLWYLPFVFISSLGVFLLFYFFSQTAKRLQAAYALGLALVVLSLLAFIEGLPPPFGIMVTVLPTVGLGIAYGHCINMPSRQKRALWLTVIAALIAVACVPIWLFGDRTTAIAYTGSSVLMIAFTTISLPRSRFLMRLSTLTLGIYLAHPFAILVLWKYTPAGTSQWLFALSVFALAAFMTAIMRKIPYVRVTV